MVHLRSCGSFRMGPAVGIHLINYRPLFRTGLLQPLFSVCYLLWLTTLVLYLCSWSFVSSLRSHSFAFRIIFTRANLGPTLHYYRLVPRPELCHAAINFTHQLDLRSAAPGFISRSSPQDELRFQTASCSGHRTPVSVHQTPNGQIKSRIMLLFLWSSGCASPHSAGMSHLLFSLLRL